MAKSFYNKVSYHYIAMATFGGSQVFNMTSTSELSSLMKEEINSVELGVSHEGASAKTNIEDSNKNKNTTKNDSTKIKETMTMA